MQRKWRREWERCKAGHLTARSKNSGLGPLKILAKTILPSVTAAAMLWATMTMPAYANPNGGQVTSGAGSISQNGNTMNITQTTNKMSINWQSFNIAANETVNFVQPGASSIALNRVVGNNASSIYGHLNANGQVFLVNTNGVLFAPGSSVNVGGIVASTLNISDSDFQKGNYTFSGNGGSVVNQGTITATNGGYAALLGGQVSNQGVIVANEGTVALGAGNAATLDFNGDGLYSLAVTQAALNAAADNRNLIQANGGQVVMTVRAANALTGSVLNNTGVIEAQSIGSKNGVIVLDGGMTGAVVNSGTLDASGKSAGQTGGTVKVLGDTVTLAPGATIDASGDSSGGFIETSGSKVNIADGAVITTAASSGNAGTWLIDPDGFTIAASGGDMTGTALTTALAKGSVTIASIGGSGSDGNINVNDTVSWSKNTLTLTATDNIYVNNVMTATGTANFAANYGSGTNADGTPMGLYTNRGATLGSFAGKINFSGSGAVTLNSAPYTVITTDSQLNAITDLGGNYVLGSDVYPWDTITWSGATGTFTGKFNGFGHVINCSWLWSPVLTATGVFGTVGNGAVVSNLGTYGAWIGADNSGGTKDAVGTLANYNYGSIVNSFASYGELDNANVAKVGGLVGVNYGLIAQSYSDSTYVTVTNIAGGLVGVNAATGKIIDCSTPGVRDSGGSNTITTPWDSGNVTISHVGGLVGENYGAIQRSSSSTQIELDDSSSPAGGFIGLNAATGTIDQAYVVKAVWAVGAPVGFVYQNDGTISNSYVNGISDTALQAGFVWSNSGTISNSYAAFGNVTGTTPCYGFAQANTGTLTNTYWSATPTNGALALDNSAGSTELTAADATNLGKYTGFDPAIWGSSVAGYPLLKQLAVYVQAGSSPLAYGDNVLSSLTALGLQWGDTVAGQFSLPAGYLDVGNYQVGSVLTTSSYSNVRDVGVIQIIPKTLTISGLIEDKTYDGTTAATLNSGAANGGLVGLVGNQTLNITYTAEAFADKNAGTDKTVNLTYTLADGANGGKASNYTIANAVADPSTGATTTTTTANIAKKSVSETFTAAGKEYDGTTNASVMLTLTGAVATDAVALNYTSAQFADQNAGQNKTVTLSGVTLTGADSSNYILQNPQQQATADIARRELDLYSSAQPGGSTTVPASSIYITNVVPGDSVKLTGSAAIASTATGLQPMNLSGLTVDNANYTLTGATGTVAIGQVSLALDHVASGTASIVSSGNTTTITTSDKAVIDWYRFNVGGGETVDFEQLSTTSIVLNRVTGSEQSVIAGAITSGAVSGIKGRVFIINANGVLFAAGSSVNVGALVASTLNMSDANFNAGNYAFTAAGGTGSVIANGDIVIIDGGFLALASQNGVANSGTVSAPGGKALLAAANQLTLTLNPSDSGLASYAIQGLSGTTTFGGVVNVAAASGNGGLIETAGNTVSLGNEYQVGTGNNGTWSWTLPSITIGSGGTFTSDFVKNNLVLRNLSLNALGGDLTVNGAVNWSSNNTLSLSAKNDININNAITINGASSGLMMSYGGDYNILTPASYSGTVLNGNGIPVAKTDTSGGIYGSINFTNSANTNGLKINGNTYTLIHSMSQLDGLDGYDGTTRTIASNYSALNNVSGYYALAQDLDASGVTYADALIVRFNGTFAGLGHKITGLTINIPNNPNATVWVNGGLFGLVGIDSPSLIRDIGLVNANVNINGNSNAGTLAGVCFGDIENVYSTGSVKGDRFVGGLVGLVDTPNQFYGQFSKTKFNTISDSFTNVTVTANGYSGGLVGEGRLLTIENSHAAGDVSVSSAYSGGLLGEALTVFIRNSYALGAVHGSGFTGGLVGGFEIAYSGDTSSYGSIENSFATGNVSGGGETGGLVGDMSFSDERRSFTVSNSYATGDVVSNGGSNAGGLIGNINASNTGKGSITITDSFATGDVTMAGPASDNIGNAAGGLIGNTNINISIDHCYATGNVAGTVGGNYVGGLVGYLGYAGTTSAAWASITDSYATGNVTGTSCVGGLVGATGGNRASIINSYATGNVTGRGHVWDYDVTGAASGPVGGLVGVNGGGTITGSYAAGNVQAEFGPVDDFMGFGYGPITNSYALKGRDDQDIAYYANGTIDQVHAARADAQQAATQQASAGQQAAAKEVGSQDGLGSQVSRTKGDTLQNTLDLLNPANLWQSTVDDQNPAANLGNFSAHVKSIEVDGAEYQLEDKDANGKDNKQ